MNETLNFDDVFVRRLYKGHFKASMTSQIHSEINEFLRSEGIREQMKRVMDSDEIWIKPNLSNARPPETGCITHPAAVKAIIDHLLDTVEGKPIRIVETKTYHKGKGMPEILAKLPPEERAVIEDKLRNKEPDQDMHDFGFNLLLELGGLKDLVERYKEDGKDVDVLNLSKQPVMSPAERETLSERVDELLGEERMPQDEIKKKLVDHIPSCLGNERKIGLISLALPKTHDTQEAYITATMKNIGLGLFLKYKSFMHKDFAKAMLYNFAIWKVGLEDRIFGIVSGPYGQDREGPIFGRVVDFPYIVGGSDLLKVDAVTAVLTLGKVDLINQMSTFTLASNTLGTLPSDATLEEILPYSLNYEPYPYESKE
ncbi:MAG TPA: DUF362 domain-containing protein [Candidatus Lokiarchaeia archaeon]|nr:DUF362 domain-containing protein [Candidatus Lokiarchaeia archaeon]